MILYVIGYPATMYIKRNFSTTGDNPSKIWCHTSYTWYYIPKMTNTCKTHFCEFLQLQSAASA